MWNMLLVSMPFLHSLPFHHPTRPAPARSPFITIPVIVGRMFQKDTEWRRVRADMKRAWRDVCEKNFNKSLDHRSFYFKQVRTWKHRG